MSPSVLNRSQNSESIIGGIFDSIIDSKSIFKLYLLSEIRIKEQCNSNYIYRPICRQTYIDIKDEISSDYIGRYIGYDLLISEYRYR